MTNLRPEDVLKGQIEKKRGQELLMPALALTAYMGMDALNSRSWMVKGNWEEIVGTAVLAGMLLWFFATRTELSALAVFLLGAAWISLIGEIGATGFLVTMGLAAWKSEDKDLAFKATVLGLGCWWIAGVLTVELAQITDLGARDEGVRQLALIGGAALWLLTILSGLPVWLSAALMAAVWFWKEPGAGLLCWAVLMSVAGLWLVLRYRNREQPQPRPAAPFERGAGAEFAAPQELEEYRYE